MKSDGSYEIFKKELDNTTVLVEAVKGINQAQRRVEELNRSEAAALNGPRCRDNSKSRTLFFQRRRCPLESKASMR